MDIRKIKALAEIMRDFELSSLEMTEGELKISLKKECAPAPAAKLPDASEIKGETSAVSEAYDFIDLNEIKSPLVGVFYASPAPDAPPFVKIGDRVKAGETLCIIEAMKLMNEITADRDGEIVDVCAQNGQIVEYGQLLFKIA